MSSRNAYSEGYQAAMTEVWAKLDEEGAAAAARWVADALGRPLTQAPTARTGCGQFQIGDAVTVGNNQRIRYTVEAVVHSYKVADEAGASLTTEERVLRPAPRSNPPELR